MTMKKMTQENPNKYSYRSDNDDGSKTVVITDLGKNKLEDIRQEMESLELEYSMLEHDDDVDVQQRLTWINTRVNTLRQFAARIRRGDKTKSTWDSAYATNCHTYLLDNVGASVRAALDQTAIQMGKTQQFVDDMERRSYPRSELQHLFHTLKHHPVWTKMVVYGEINKSDITTATDLSNQLDRVTRARQRYQWRKDMEKDLEETKDRVTKLEFKDNLTKILEQKHGHDIEVSDSDIANAWRNTGLSYNQIAEQMNITKSKVQRLLKK